MKIADYFDRIYIINLPERVDRRRHMEKEIGKLSLTPNSDKVHFLRLSNLNRLLPSSPEVRVAYLSAISQFCKKPKPKG